MLTPTECSVNVACHACRVDRANQLGWHYDAQPRASLAASHARPGWLTRTIARLRHAHGPQVVASA